VKGMAGLLGSIRMDGPWDIKRGLGTVPVEPDEIRRCSASRATPTVAVHPLDEDGKSLR